MAIQGVIFPNQKVSAADHAALFELFITDGIISGCGTTSLRNTLTISSGLFVLKGRLAKIVGSQEIVIPDNIRSTTVRLIAYIDLNQVSTSEEFKQLQFRLDESSAALVQQDINTGTGTLYEIEWASLTVDAQGNITACNVKIKNAYASGGEGHGTGGIPTFTYMVNGVDKSSDSSYVQVIDDGSNNWRIKFLKNGTLTFTQLGGASSGIDLFLVGGGGGSGDRAGGGGGYTKTVNSVIPTTGTSYPIVIGNGGLARADGEGSSAFGSSVEGGKGGGNSTSGLRTGGAGGSGGGGYSPQVFGDNVCEGGSNGSSGETSGGAGQGSTTKEFGESSGTVYAGGGAGLSQTSDSNETICTNAGGNGGGGACRGGTNTDTIAWAAGDSGHPGVANTGGGGGAGNVSGGSGIIIIRNHRAA